MISKGNESTSKKIQIGGTSTIKKQGNITNTKKGVSTQSKFILNKQRRKN